MNTYIFFSFLSCAIVAEQQLFEDEKEESVEIGGVNFHKKSCSVETFVPKRDVEQTYEYNA